MSNMGKDMLDLELMIINSMMQLTTLESKEIHDASQLVHELTHDVRTEITEQLLSSSTCDRGLIVWLKPNALRQINPEPIHLKETLDFLISNSHYESSGAHSYDLIGMDENFQYESIVASFAEEKELTISVEKDLNVEDVLRIQQMYDKRSGTSSNNTADPGVQSIIAAAKKIFDDIFTHKTVQYSNKAGELDF